MDLIKDAPTELDPKYTQLRDFLNLLDAVLGYHHDRSDREPSATTAKFAAVFDLMHEQFFEHIFVDRPERHQLVDLCSDTEVILFSGPAGSGKTTTLLMVQHDLSKDPEVLVHYVNLKKRAAQLRGLNRGPNRATVCALLYQDLYDRRIAERPDLVEEFLVHGVQTRRSCTELAQSIRESRAPTSTADWIAAIRSADFVSWKIEIDREDAKASKDDENLQILVGFLAKKWKRVVVILDEVDRFDLPLQAEVIKKAIDIAGVCTPLIAIRTANLADVRRAESEGRYGDRVHHQRSVDAVRQRTLLTKVETVQDFIHKRMKFLQKVAPSLHIDLPPPGQLAAFDDLLRRLLSVDAVGSVLAVLDGWFNHSLRHIGSAISGLVGRFVAEVDPHYTARQIIAADTDQLRLRRLRNGVYKYLTSAGRALYTSEQGVMNAYSGEDDPPALPLAAVSVLSFLVSRGGRTTLGRLREHLVNVSTRNGERMDVVELVERLRRPQGADGFGFVQFEDGSRTAGATDDSLIEILPGGLVFRGVFSLTCEYLFWCALDTRVVPHSYGKPLTYSETAVDDDLRVWVGATFLHQCLLPRLDTSKAQGTLSGATGMPLWLDAEIHVWKLVHSLRKYQMSKSTLAQEAAAILNQVESKLDASSSADY